MDTFTALSVPTRRKIVELLAAKGTLPAGRIVEHFSVSGAAVSQHLKVLRQAKLVSVRRVSQQRLYALEPAGLRAFEEWAHKLGEQWAARLDRLDAVLAEEMRKRKSSKK